MTVELLAVPAAQAAADGTHVKTLGPVIEISLGAGIWVA
jgi:hypothetical protein